MGDMADTFRAMKAHKAEQREARAVVNIDALHKLGIPAVEQSKNVFRLKTAEGTVMYYVSSNTWQHKGKVMRGDVTAFHGWLKNKGFA